jgi:uncharacterized protein (TIGR03437 family)
MSRTKSWRKRALKNMFKRAVIFLAVSLAAFSQTRSRLAEYALVLEDEPVARVVKSRAALRGPDGEAHARRIRAAQGGVLAALRDRGVAVTGATQTLVNAVLVTTTREMAAELQKLPGVKYVVRAPRVRPSLDRAEEAANVGAAWTAVGGSAQAGAGMKIGIIDSGIDLTHPGFQDASLSAPAGFPKGNTAYTNGKVIVARSYIAKDLAPGFTSHDRNTIDPATISQPDDDTPRDHIGHGTALAMIAAGAPNTDRANSITIQGVAPKAYIGNYKIFGSPGINDFSSFAAVNDALTDAIADGMDVVTLSMNEGDPPFYAPLDTQPECNGPCDVYSQAVEAAVAKGLVVVVSAGNSGADGKHGPTWVTVHFPGTAPSAITVGALTNTRVMYQSIRLEGQTLRARFANGPQLQASLRAPVKDAGSACNALAGGSLAGAIALIQRGDCFIDQKLNNAQKAGAVAAIVIQSAGDDITGTPLPAATAGIPAALVGASDADTLKNFTGPVTLDPAYVSTEASGGTVWAASSRGPSVGDFGNTKTNVIKPEIAAVGVNIYTAAQRLDPSGDAYNATGYTSVTGTSYATAVVAGAAALVKQKNPGFTPAQIKSALVNTANPNVQDNGAQASVRSVGAGKLDAGAAVSTTITVSPATISFGEFTVGAALPINRTLTLANSGSTPANLTFTVQQRQADSNASVSVSTTSLTVGANSSNSVTVTLRGTRPNPGVYEGAIVIASGAQTIRVPYLYMVGDNTPYDVYPIGFGSFVGGTSDTGWEVDLRVVDQYGVPVVGTPARFTAVSGGGKVTVGDDRTFNLGIAAALVDLSANTGEQIFRGTVGGPAGPSVDFSGYARPYPTISSGGVANAAPGGSGVAPGSYVSIYGTTFTEGATQVESTPFLPVTLSNVSVTFDADGVSLPGRLHFVSPGQVNAQVPWEFQGKSSVKVKVWSDYLAGNVVTVPLAQYAPGVFATTDANYARISASNPAKRGQTIILWANGLGPVTNQPGSGEATAGLSSTTATPTVTIGGKAAAVDFSGLTPGAVGLYQINLRLAVDTPTGDQPMVISIGGVSSGALTVPVQ